MESVDAIDLARDAIFVLLKVAGPVMLIALMVGLTIALFQALTQIQEITLTFVPKIIAIFVSLLALLPYMGSVLGSFMDKIAQRIIDIG
jgi:flagellar biosynthetic protein FliQ